MEGLSVICAHLWHVEYDDYSNPIVYEKDEFCLDNLKDLLRFLRRDDPKTREVFKQICKWNIVFKALMPILENCQEDHNLVLNVVKVLVFLTMPIDPSSNDTSQQIEYLWDLKFAITCSNVIPVILTLLEVPLENLQQEAFTEDDWKLVQLVLTFFRNVLAVQDFTMLQKAGGSATHYASLKDKFLELLFHENVMELILVLAQHVVGSCNYLRHESLLILETLYYIFMGQDAELIATTQLKDSEVEEEILDSVNTLKSIMEEEKERTKVIRRRNLSHYSKYNGTFSRITMDGSKSFLIGNPSSTTYRTHIFHHGPLKRIAWDQKRSPSLKNNLLVLLHEFTNQLLSGSYNVLMQSIHKDIEREHPSIQNTDVVVFFRVAHFVISFQYYKFLTFKDELEAKHGILQNMEKDELKACMNNYAFNGDICGPIASSMNESMFHIVISKWRNAYDGLKQLGNYTFLSAAGSLMKIMIRMLDLVLKLYPNDSKEPQTARVLLYKLFYDQTSEGVTQFIFNQIKTFDFHKQSKSDLADLVEMVHVIIRLVENLQAHGTLRVSRKSRQQKRKKTSIVKENSGKPNEELATIDNENDIIGCEKSAELSTSEKGNSCDMFPAQDEHDHVNEPQTSIPEISDFMKIVPKTDKNSELSNDDDLDSGLGDCSGDDEQLNVTDEIDFDVSILVSAIANNFIIHNLCWLLKFYKTNSVCTNHYILCMFRRICDDLELSPMFYQLSFLTIFYDILVEQQSYPCKDYENIVSFLKTLVRRMMRKMKNQPLLFVELLFSKTRKDCHIINADSLLDELGYLKKETRNWANASNNGHSASSLDKRFPINIADALGDDDADVVISHELYRNGDQEEEDVQWMIENSDDDHPDSIINSNNGGKKNSDNQGRSVKDELPKSSKRRKKFVMNTETEEKIKDLYKKYEGNMHCSQLIAEALDPDGKVSRIQVSNMLKRLGLKLTSTENFLDDQNPGNEKDIGGSVKRASRIRRRVSAFSEEQEIKIKALYETFKDHNKCNLMIANTLDAKGTITALQVSRKLKQLGLFVAKQNISKPNMSSRVENSDDPFTNNISNSDDETLSSLKRRSRRRVSAFSEDHEIKIKDLFETFKDHDKCNYMIANALDDKGAISAFQVSHKLKQLGLFVAKQNVSTTNLNLRVEDSNDHFTNNISNSDDETLTSLVNRTSDEFKGKKGGKLAKILVGRPEAEDDSGNGAIQFQKSPESRKSGEENEKNDDVNENVEKSDSARRKRKLVIDFEDEDEDE